MKFIILLTVLMVLGAHSKSLDYDSLASLSGQDQFRVYLKHHLKENLDTDVNNLCVHYLNNEQTIFGNQKVAEFIACGNTTIDTYVNKLNFDVKLSDLSSVKTLRNYIAPLCEVADDIYACVRGAEPIIDLCIDARERLFKVRLYTIIPLIRQTVCLKGGQLFADILEEDDGYRCLEETFEWLTNISFDSDFEDDNMEVFFASESLCRKFNKIRLDLYKQLAECSTGVQNITDEMIRYFCEGTECQRFFTDLECKNNGNMV